MGKIKTKTMQNIATKLTAVVALGQAL